MKVTVYFSPSDAKEGVYRKASTVLVDVLRMTSTVSTYLSHGARAVQVHADPAAAKAAFAKLKRGEGLLAGEAHWEKVAGFPMSGSPLDSTREKVKGRTVCLSTRSALALKHLKGAETLLMGAFVNLSDVYDTVLRLKKDVVVVCGVSEYGTAPEDEVFAGMLCDFLQNTVGSEPVLLAESAKKAIAFYKPWQGRLPELLQGSPEGKELAQKGCEKDLVFCARMNRLDGVPLLKGSEFVRESAPKPKLKTPLAVKTESNVPAKGKAIKVHVPLFPKNPEHPTPELDPKKTSVPAKSLPPVKGGKAPAPKPVVKGAVPAKGAAPKPPAKPAAKTGTSKPMPPPGKGIPGKVQAPSLGKGAEKAPAGKLPVRKTPLFSKRTVALPFSAPKSVDPNQAVSHAMDALKASLAHLKDRKAQAGMKAVPPAAGKSSGPASQGKGGTPPAGKGASAKPVLGKPVLKSR